MRVRVVYTLVACCAILVSILVFPPDAKTIERVNCTDWIPRAPGSAQVLRACWIDQPTVTRRMTEYRDVTFAPGDVVTVSGGGCVQTGGVGDTWKRYIDPQANSGTLYHGEILIPGITAGLDRIQRYINTPMRVPTGIDPSQLYLRLGYEDDDYGDNGYYDHDDGTGDQCRGIGPAFLSIVAERNVPPQAPPPRAPFDLTWTAVDDNLIPLNPSWAGGQPDPFRLCGFNYISGPLETFSGVNLGSPPCTTQMPTFDTAGYGWNAFWCSLGTSVLQGHANWFPGTYTGGIRWSDKSDVASDDDYNLKMSVPNNAGLIAGQSEMQLEFDSDETIDHFQTATWNAIHLVVDRGDDSFASDILGGIGHEREAIATGLIGLDCTHHCGTEIHPVWALAVHTGDNPGDDVWTIFVRNWGNEGYCSRNRHYVDFPSNTYTFRIPWRSGAASVNVLYNFDRTTTNFLTNDASHVRGPLIRYAPGEGVLVSFWLANPEDESRVNGDLHLQWVNSQGQPLRPLSFESRRGVSTVTNSEQFDREVDEPEDYVKLLVDALSPDEKKSVSTHLTASLKLDSASIGGPIPAVRIPHLPSHRTAQVPTVREVPDLQESAEIDRAFRVLVTTSLRTRPEPIEGVPAEIVRTLQTGIIPPPRGLPPGPPHSFTATGHGNIRYFGLVALLILIGIVIWIILRRKIRSQGT